MSRRAEIRREKRRLMRIARQRAEQLARLKDDRLTIEVVPSRSDPAHTDDKRGIVGKGGGEEMDAEAWEAIRHELESEPEPGAALKITVTAPPYEEAQERARQERRERRNYKRGEG